VVEVAGKKKLRISTAWLSGCSGCHMSMLNMDEKIIEIADRLEFVRSPLVDRKNFEPCDVGLVEGAVSDDDNVAVVSELRASCRELVAMGDCAVFGGMTSLRNLYDKEDILRCAFDGKVADDKDIDEHVPKLTENALGVDAYVRVDHYIPGCPPSPDSILQVLSCLLKGEPVVLPKELIHYDSRIRRRSDEND